MKFNFRIISLPINYQIQFQNHQSPYFKINSISESSKSVIKFDFRIISLPILKSVKFQNHQSPYFQICPESSSACEVPWLLGSQFGFCHVMQCFSVLIGHSEGLLQASLQLRQTWHVSRSSNNKVEHLDSIVGGRQSTVSIILPGLSLILRHAVPVCLHRCQWDQVVNWIWMSDMGFIACRSWVLSLWAIKNPLRWHQDVVYET